jgi:hypothetical protein
MKMAGLVLPFVQRFYGEILPRDPRQKALKIALSSSVGDRRAALEVFIAVEGSRPLLLWRPEHKGVVEMWKRIASVLSGCVGVLPSVTVLTLRLTSKN